MPHLYPMFLAIALPTAFLALSMLMARRVVRAVLALLGAVVGLAFIYFLLGADAAGAAQLMVYAGGVMVLLLFGVMTVADNEPHQGPVSRPTEVLSGLALAGLLLLALVRVFGPVLQTATQAPLIAAYTGGTLAGAGRELVRYQAAPFEWATLLLLLALAFAAPLAAKAGKASKL